MDVEKCNMQVHDLKGMTVHTFLTRNTYILGIHEMDMQRHVDSGGQNT